MERQVNAGFSLVEVLVSVLVLSVGIVGAAAMQLTALRDSQQSGFHNIGLQLAAEIADQLRVIEAGHFDDASNPFLSLDFKPGDTATTPPVLCFDDSVGCGEVALFAASIYQLQSRLSQQLPQGRLKVCRDASPWDEASKSYRWDCRTAGGAGPIVVKLGWRELDEGSKAAHSGTEAAPQFVLLVHS